MQTLAESNDLPPRRAGGLADAMPNQAAMVAVPTGAESRRRSQPVGLRVRSAIHGAVGAGGYDFEVDLICEKTSILAEAE